MSTKERDRLKVITRLIVGEVTRRIAAQQLKVGERQLRRLVKAYQNEGDVGLVSKLRGRKSNNHLPEHIRKQAIELVRLNYSDFGPTLAHEKLNEVHKLKVSKSSVRSLMIEHIIWKPRKWKPQKIHKRRERRECFGELIQMDGSYHDWFEGRAPKCCLLVLIDDATSQLMLLKFVKHESVFSYFQCLREYLETIGRPLSLYTDRHAIFETTRKREKSYKETQFHRAMKDLGIELILALSPQAKGRVERVNGTLQDRLVKEMRLAGISSIEEGNLFAPDFLKAHNQKFAKKPKSTVDAHRVLEENVELDQMLCLHHERKISKDLMVNWGGESYQIIENNCRTRMGGKSVLVLELQDGSISLLFRGKYLKFVNFNDMPCARKVINDINFKKPRGGHPSSEHPWKQWIPHPQKQEIFFS
jgi:hypothetical protein